MHDDFESPELEDSAGSTFTVDDGRCWAAWHVWNMRTRERMSLGRYEAAPDRPLVTKPVIKKNRGKK